MFGDFTFKVADLSERASALELQRKVYAEDIGHIPSDEIDDRADFLVVVTPGGDVVAAFRMAGPELRPFDLERYVDLSAFIAPNRYPALIGRLCVRHDHRSVSRRAFLPMGMMKLAYMFSRKRGFTDLVMYTFPHLINFYRSTFFRPVNLIFDHPGYQRPMHVMHLDLLELEKRYRDSSELAARLMFAADSPRFLV